MIVKCNVSRPFWITAWARNREIWACKSRFYTQLAGLKVFPKSQVPKAAALIVTLFLSSCLGISTVVQK